VKTQDNEDTFLVDVGFSLNALYSPIVLKNGSIAKGISRFETISLQYEALPGISLSPIIPFSPFPLLFLSLHSSLSVCSLPLLIHSSNEFCRGTTNAKRLDAVSITRKRK
jgi:hypothetical protein